jgi:hypothetical protein
MSLPETFGSAAGTFIRENKWEQLGKSLGMEPAAALPTLAVGRPGANPVRHAICQRAIAPVGLKGVSGSQACSKWTEALAKCLSCLLAGWDASVQ